MRLLQAWWRLFLQFELKLQIPICGRLQCCLFWPCQLTSVLRWFGRHSHPTTWFLSCSVCTGKNRDTSSGQTLHPEEHFKERKLTFRGFFHNYPFNNADSEFIYRDMTQNILHLRLDNMLQFCRLHSDEIISLNHRFFFALLVLACICRSRQSIRLFHIILKLTTKHAYHYLVKSRCEHIVIWHVHLFKMVGEMLMTAWTAHEAKSHAILSAWKRLMSRSKSMHS